MRKLVLFALVLAVFVVLLGAFTRLTDAGLGCPDWPGCYGFLSVPSSAEQIQVAEQAFPERPVESYKAWNEMIHRYFAGSLGLLVLVIAVTCLTSKRLRVPKKLPAFLVMLVCFQALLGMWTVTLNLMPLVVMGHLLGGFAVLSCLFLLYLRLTPFRIPGGDPGVRKLGGYGLVGLGLVIMQIGLGGWVSANYAALACTELPVCEANWANRIDLAGAFHLPEANDYEFGVHNYEQRMTMHILHRFGAVVVFIYLIWLGMKIYKSAASDLCRSLSFILISVLAVQVLLGISNVVYKLPLAVAVAHNGVGAALLLALVMINYTLYRKT